MDTAGLDKIKIWYIDLIYFRIEFIVAYSFNQVTVMVKYEPPLVGLVEKVDNSSLQMWDAKHIFFSLKLLKTNLKTKLMNAIHRVTC